MTTINKEINQPSNFKYSIVIPVYKTSKYISSITESIFQNFAENIFDTEIIFVDDGCPEDSWFEIKRICKNKKMSKVFLYLEILDNILPLLLD